MSDLSIETIENINENEFYIKKIQEILLKNSILLQKLESDIDKQLSIYEELEKNNQ